MKDSPVWQAASKNRAISRANGPIGRGRTCEPELSYGDPVGDLAGGPHPARMAPPTSGLSLEGLPFEEYWAAHGTGPTGARCPRLFGFTR